ncbi:MAG: FKBP-type peptidyl-prolyl cis-trans isomerase [Sphingobacteriales bacterium]|jgi:FKBP-type peptidyl-prolyl cis-trans isomerase FkpA|nr:FKBP-type peptidyl-prolyl cis-trans isomerase [Sphingobacteriales bacterium]
MKKLLLLLLIPVLVYSCKKSDAEQARIDKQILLKYIADSSLVVDSTASGLYYAIADSGSGVSPSSGSYITVYYKGYYTDGTIFDQNPAGTPINGFLGGFIPGWIEGLPKIKKGGKIKLLVPSSLAYGNAGYASIPPNTVLIFDVELVDVR